MHGNLAIYESVSILWGMEIRTRLVANIFTQKMRPAAAAWTLLGMLVVYGASFLRLERGIDLTASGDALFTHHEWWRAWSALLVHADLSHLLSNTPWLLLFSFLLNGVYGPAPVLLAFLITGLGNFLVVATMPSEAHLLGASGVVHFVGAMWVTLHVLLDHREGLRPRFASALFLMLLLFVPDNYRPGISYVGHAVGFTLGVLTGAAYWFIKRAHLHSFDRWETRFIPEPDFDWSGEPVRALVDETPQEPLRSGPDRH